MRTSTSALIRMVPRGLRMSCPRMPMNSSVDVLVCRGVAAHRLGDGLVDRFVEAREVRQVLRAACRRPAVAQIFSTLARRARYSVIIASTAKPASHAEVRVRFRRGSAARPRGPRPLPLSSCSCAGVLRLGQVQRDGPEGFRPRGPCSAVCVERLAFMARRWPRTASQAWRISPEWELQELASQARRDALERARGRRQAGAAEMAETDGMAAPLDRVHCGLSGRMPIG